MKLSLYRTYIFFFTVFICGYIHSMEQSCQRNVVMILGPSCSGKSTLAYALHTKLGEQWKLIEIDDIEDHLLAQEMTAIREDKDTLIDYLIAEMQVSLNNGSKIIVDTNIYNERLLSFAKMKKVLVSCSREILLQRNEERDQKFQRTYERAKRAREFMLQTCENFEQLKAYDVKIDSSSTSIERSVEMIMPLLN